MSGSTSKRNHCREARKRAEEPEGFLSRASPKRVRRAFALLTRTYHEVGNPESGGLLQCGPSLGNSLTPGWRRKTRSFSARSLVTSTVLSRASAKNPIWRLSGDQNGKLAPSVPLTCCAAEAERVRIPQGCFSVISREYPRKRPFSASCPCFCAILVRNPG